jgi:predicted PurR-regulated permease PerM
VPTSTESVAPTTGDNHPESPWTEVPWRTIVASVGIVFAMALSLMAVYLASRVLIWILIAGFLAVVLARPVGWVQVHWTKRRGGAVAIVVGATLSLLSALVALFLLPVRSQLVAILSDLPGTVHQAAQGQGPVGHLVTQLHLDRMVRDHEATLTDAAKSINASYPTWAASGARAVVIVITIAVMTCVMLSQSGSLSRTALGVIPARHRDAVALMARNAAAAVSGYMIGNLLISLCAGLAAFALLLILRVPSAAVLSLWVAFADLIPLVGATLGAVVAVIAALLVSPSAGIIAGVFFLVYQQFENSVLQVVVMARTVRVSSLMVLLSVLVGAELFGVVGAVLALPAAGAGSVVVKELWRHRSRTDGLLVVGRVDRDGDAPAPPRHRVVEWTRRLRSRPAGPASPDRQE